MAQRTSEGAVRLLTCEDVPDVVRLAMAAGWNQTAGDIEMLLRMAPEGCLGIECDGRVVATTTLLPRDDRLAWLGMVLTDASSRRRGFARRLVERALEYAGKLGVTTVKLDATDMGHPLYVSLGFEDEQYVERWAGRLKQKRSAFDQLAGGDSVLRALASRSEVFAEADSFALVRPGARARYLGPFVAASGIAARTLIRSAFEPGDGDLFYWDVLPANRDAIGLVRELGFERVRSLVRMCYGRAYREAEESRFYAIRGFELG